MDTNDSLWSQYVSELYGYFSVYTSGNLIPEDYKDFLDGAVKTIKDNNGPSLDLVEATDIDPETGETVTGYKISFDGTTYDTETDLMDAVESSSYYTGGDCVCGVLGPGEGNGVAELRAKLYSAMNPSLVPPETVTDQRIPGTNVILEASVDGDNGKPSIGIFAANQHIDILPRTDKLTDPSSISLNYIHYMIVKSSSGDILFKCYRWQGAYTYTTWFDFSMNRYVTNLNSTSPRVYDDMPPTIHHRNSNDKDAKEGGFGVVQYDYATASNVSLSENHYNYGVVLMNPMGAPLVFITKETTALDRTATTSEYSISGSTKDTPGSETEQTVQNEKLLRPVTGSSDFPLINDVFVLAPFVSPSSKNSISKWSRWMIIADAGFITSQSAIGASGKTTEVIRAGTATYFNDHGFCLNGGKDCYHGV